MLFCSAKARLSKKAKTNAPTDEIEPERTSEGAGGDADIAMDDPVPQGQDTYVDPPEVNPASPHVDPPSPTANPPSPTADPPSPAKASDKPASPNTATDDVVITGVGHTSPGNPVALSKHSAKVESAAEEKGKWKTDLSSCAHLTAQELHSGYLNRLYTSRDYEAGLVNLMKERYEVTSIQTFYKFFFVLYINSIVAPKGRFISSR